jgi:hypothetical protein
MRLNEIVAEKLRTLAQRRRPTDLSDLAMVILGHEIDDTRVRALADRKFELVKDTDNRSRIERTIEAMRDQYDAASRLVPACAPGCGGDASTLPEPAIARRRPTEIQMPRSRTAR